MAGNHLTARAFLAKEIRLAREATGASQKAVAKKIYVSESLIAAWESGRLIPKPDALKRFEELHGTKGMLSRLLEDLVSNEISPEWLGKWLSIEAAATSLYWYESSVVPGLLQTKEYANAVLVLNRNEVFNVEDRVNSRLLRQEVLEGENPPVMVAVLDEAILHRPIGGETVMYEQLRHIIEVAKRPEVIIYLIPFGAGEHAGLAGPFIIAGFEGTEVAYVDNALRGDVAEIAGDVIELKHRWEMLRSSALSAEGSIELIWKVAHEKYGHAVEEGESQQQ